jgi:hypothetical protein
MLQTPALTDGSEAGTLGAVTTRSLLSEGSSSNGSPVNHTADLRRQPIFLLARGDNPERTVGQRLLKGERLLWRDRHHATVAREISEAAKIGV